MNLRSEVGTVCKFTYGQVLGGKKGPVRTVKNVGTRGDRWVTTVVQGAGRQHFLRVTNVSDKDLILHEDTRIGIWLPKDQVPRTQGFVSVGRRRYSEWQNLAYQATTDEEDPVSNLSEEYQGPMVDRSQHTVPKKLMLRSGSSWSTLSVGLSRKI